MGRIMHATHYGDRARLPNRRGNLTFTFKHSSDIGHEYGYRCTLGYDEAGDVRELFVNADLNQSMLDAAASDAAIAASLALQYGTPIDVLAAALRRHQNGAPASPLGGALDLIIANGWAHNWGLGDLEKTA